MKFERNLKQNRVTRWRPYYLNYSRMKYLLSEMVKEGNDNSSFLRELDNNIVHVSNFYRIRETELSVMAETLGKLNSDQLHSALEAIMEESMDLCNFASVNIEGVRKIAKKYDKCAKGSNPPSFHSSLVTDVLSEIRQCEIYDYENRIRAIRDYTITTKNARFSGPSPSKKPKILSDSTGSLGEHLLPSDANLGRFIARHHDTHPPKDLSFLSENIYTIIIVGSIFLTLVCCSVVGIGSPEFTVNSYIALALTISVLIALYRGYPSDAVMVSSTLALVLSKVLTPEEAWSGFSNNVVLSVAVLMVVSAGVKATSLIENLFLKLLGRPRSFSSALFRLMVPAIILNIGISNTAVMSVLLPVVEIWAAQIGINKKLFLMPLSYMLLISGVATIFSTSSNLITQGLLIERKLPIFGVFEMMPIITPCVIATQLYTLIFAPLILGESNEKKNFLNQNNHMGVRQDKQIFFRLQLESYTGKALGGTQLAKYLEGKGRLLSIERLGVYFKPHKSFILATNDVLQIQASSDVITKLIDGREARLLPLDRSFVEDSYSLELHEVVLDFLCPLIGKTLEECDTHSFYKCSIVGRRSTIQEKQREDATHAVNAVTDKSHTTAVESNCTITHPLGSLYSFERQDSEQLIFTNAQESVNVQTDSNLRAGITSVISKTSLSLEEPDSMALDSKAYTEIEPQDASNLAHRCRLRIGDTLILHSNSASSIINENNGHFALVRSLKPKTQYSNITNMSIAAFSLLVLVVLVSSGMLPLLECSMISAGILIFSGCISLQEGLSAINLRTLLTIIGAFGLGKAVTKTHVACIFSTVMATESSSSTPLLILASIYTITCVMGMLFHATAVVILLFPVCEYLSDEPNSVLGLHQLLGCVMVGAGCQFLSPISYQTNLMAYSAGGYAITDFPKFGFGLVILIGCISVPLCYHFL